MFTEAVAMSWQPPDLVTPGAGVVGLVRVAREQLFSASMPVRTRDYMVRHCLLLISLADSEDCSVRFGLWLTLVGRLW